MTRAEFAAVVVGNCQDLAVRILVTNDDGIDSPGLHHLARQLTTVGEVTVLAPSRQYSGAGTAIGHLGEPLPDVHRATLPELAGIAAYHFDGPPALAALLACKQLFGATPDLLVSGINEGWNVGQTVHFSGTVGAALAANVLGVTGISVSQKGGRPQFWETAAAIAVDVINDLPPETTLLNVNVPNLAYDELKGCAYTTLSQRSPYAMARAYLRPKTEAVFEADFERGGRYDNYEGSDAHAVEQGLVSITRLSTLQAIAPTPSPHRWIQAKPESTGWGGCGGCLGLVCVGCGSGGVWGWCWGVWGWCSGFCWVGGVGVVWGAGFGDARGFR